MIIDFHTHPFLSADTNICRHKEYCDMTPETTRRDLEKLGISVICGSVLDQWGTKPHTWETVKEGNKKALKLKELYGDFYIPGFHVHPAFVKESCEEVERMSKLGVRLCGELVPYWHGWNDYGLTYDSKELSEILDVVEDHHMILSVHSMDDDAMDKMVKEHPNLVIVAAHPGEYPDFMRHLDRMKMSENYYLDLSGYGVFRHGMLKHGIDECGAERFLFGSDFPTCSASMYLGAVMLDYTITDADRELVLGGNAKRILGI